MNKKYVSLGLFLVISLGLLFWLAQNVGALGGAKGHAYTVRLDHAAGIVKDNAVKIAGVKVGIIEDVEVDHKTAVLHLRVDKEVELHEDSIAIVRAKSLLGEKYLQLDPGSLDTPVLASGAQIGEVREVFEIDQMLNALQPILGGEDSIGAMVQPLVSKLDQALGSAMGSDGQEPLMTKEELQKSIDDVQASIAAARRTVENLEPKIDSTLANADTLIADADRLINNPRIPRILADVEKISSTTAQHLPGLLAKTERALEAIDRVSNELTPERMAKVGEILDDVEVTTSNLRTMSEDIKDIGGDLGPVIANLRILLDRAASLDELTIRQFIQKEGMRVNLNVPKNAKGRIDELERAAGQ